MLHDPVIMAMLINAECFESFGVIPMLMRRMALLGKQAAAPPLQQPGTPRRRWGQAPTCRRALPAGAPTATSPPRGAARCAARRGGGCRARRSTSGASGGTRTRAAPRALGSRCGAPCRPPATCPWVREESCTNLGYQVFLSWEGWSRFLGLPGCPRTSGCCCGGSSPRQLHIPGCVQRSAAPQAH